jgi:hypothetical protein
MHEAARLFCQCRRDFRMGVAERADGNSAAEVEESLPRNIPDGTAMASRQNEIEPCIGRDDVTFKQLSNFLLLIVHDGNRGDGEGWYGRIHGAMAAMAAGQSDREPRLPYQRLRRMAVPQYMQRNQPKMSACRARLPTRPNPGTRWAFAFLKQRFEKKMWLVHTRQRRRVDR